MKNKTPKRKIAAQMLSGQEKSKDYKTAVYDSYAWIQRKKARQDKQRVQGKKKDKKPSGWVSRRSLKKNK